jgi:PTH1 family peptidyl-tRNA hydrolase
VRLIIGLGNPGEKYQKTRHNIGFMILEKIAQKRGAVFRLEPRYESRFADMGDLQNRIKLVEPQTFMNESGRAVRKCKDYWKIDSEDIWVIHDDVDLTLGKVRINLGGTSAGHKGVESIIQAIGEQFWRIRVGVGRSERISTEEWVLMNFAKSETKKLAEIIDTVSDFVLESLVEGIKEQTINI